MGKRKGKAPGSKRRRRKWLAGPGGAFDVTRFMPAGAGNGTWDCSRGFQRAFMAARRIQGGLRRIQVPPGNFLTRSTIQVANVANLVLCGYHINAGDFAERNH